MMTLCPPLQLLNIFTTNVSTFVDNLYFIFDYFYILVPVFWFFPPVETHFVDATVAEFPRIRKGRENLSFINLSTIVISNTEDTVIVKLRTGRVP